MKDPLTIPEAVAKDPNSVEVFRVWVAVGAQHVSLRTGVWDDPLAWGMMLVDLARHVVRAHVETNGWDSEEALARIRAGFDAEWSSPTDEGRGEVV